MESLKRWYVLRSKPQKEDILCKQVSVRGYEVYYPSLKTHPVNPRAKCRRPFFPGYMFVHLDLEEVGLSTFQWLPFSAGLVCFGGEPAIVNEALIYTLKRRVQEFNHVGSPQNDLFQSGDHVRIKDGPLSGYKAIFDASIAGGERVRVLLEFLSGRHARLELGASLLERL